MPKNDNAHSIRLVDSLRKNGNVELAEQLAKQYPLSKSASIEKKLEWAQTACSFLEEHLEEPEIIKVRKECRKTCPGHGVIALWEMRKESFRK